MAQASPSHFTPGKLNAGAPPSTAHFQQQMRTGDGGDDGELSDGSIEDTIRFPSPGTTAPPTERRGWARSNAAVEDTPGGDAAAAAAAAAATAASAALMSARSLPKYVALSPVFLEPSLHGSDLSKLLYWKCVKGDTAAVQSLLRQQADVNYADRVAGTPLHGACRHNQLHVAQILLETRAEVNAMPRASRDEFAPPQDSSATSFPLQTPLYYACRDNNQELIDFLLTHGAAIDFVHKAHGLVDSPLNCAQQYGHLQLFLDLEQLIGSVAKPTIVEQPPAQEVVLEGRPLVMSVKAVAAEYPLTYQWYHDDAAVPGATGPRLSVELAHKLMHEGSYVCFVRAMYSKLTGAVEFPPVLAGGQPAPGTAGTNDTVSEACVVRVESMVERLFWLRERIAGQKDEAEALRGRKREVELELGEVRYQIDALRPQVLSVRLERDATQRRLRAELERFLRLKKSCLMMMEEAGQTLAGLADFDSRSDLDATMQRIIEEEKASENPDSPAANGFFGGRFKDKIDALTGRVAQLGAGTYAAVAKVGRCASSSSSSS
jgi:hypothetical protein